MSLRRIPRPEGVVELRLDRPDRRNALDDTLSARLVAELANVGPQARAVLLRGSGPAFCAGYDLHDLDVTDTTTLAATAEGRVVPHDPPVPRAIEACPVPVIAGLHGPVFGGGLEVALACDVRTAAPDTLLGVPAAQLGLVYSYSGLQRFVAAFGPSLTRDLLLTGRRLDADEARRIGVVRDGDPLAVATAVARGSVLAQRGNRLLLQALAAATPATGQAVALRAEALSSDALLTEVRAFQSRAGRHAPKPVAASHAAAIPSSATSSR